MASTNDAADEEDITECAICFDHISEALPLPCQCQVPYCLTCWDRALAAAFNSSGTARCPTCRGPVRVDFDPEGGNGHGRLIFSAQDEGEDETSRSSVVNRLAEQAAPLMARLLRQHGSEHPMLRAMAREPAAALATRPVRKLKALLQQLGGDPAGCVEKADIIERVLARAGGASKTAALVCASESAELEQASADERGSALYPRCVCGGHLERLDGRSRCRQLIAGDGRLAGLPPEQLERWVDLQLATGQTCVVCDLCDGQLPPHTPVYTCGNGDSTILHPTTYDVCEACFVRYAVEEQGDEGLATERRE